MGNGVFLFGRVIQLRTVEDMEEGGGREGSENREKVATSFMDDPL